MCLASKPKVIQQATSSASSAPAKPPVYMRNPYLDGMGVNGETMGRNSLRVDMGTPAARAPVAAPRPIITPWTPPVRLPGGRPRRPTSPIQSRPPQVSLPRTNLTMGGGGGGGGSAVVAPQAPAPVLTPAQRQPTLSQDRGIRRMIQ